jgi:Lanthionine synthetase C-like protein
VGCEKQASGTAKDVPALSRRAWHGDDLCRCTLRDPELDALLLDAGRFIWAAGPLNKGSNLCHGTGGNGYAFLKLYRRTSDPVWLDRARQFAVTAVVQYRGSQLVVGRGRYSFWTGDVGLAIYLSDCIIGEPRFPTNDVF